MTRTNLITNPSFEVNTTGWTATGSGGISTLSRSTAQAAVGSASLSIAANANGTSTSARTYCSNMTVVAGQTYTFQVRMRSAATARNVVIAILWNNGANVTGSTSTAVGVTTTGGWTTYTRTGTAPAGTTTGYVEFGVRAASGALASGEVHYADALMFEQAATADTYFDGDSPNSAWTGTSHDSTSVYTPPPPAPTANFTSVVNYLSVGFTDTSTDTPTSWAWNFGDGATSTSQNPTHVYAAAGTYSVTLTATNAGGSDGETKTVTAIAPPPPPVANFTVAEVFLEVAFTDTSTNTPTSWAWNFGDGTSSTAQNPTKTYADSGTYTVTLTATSAWGSDTETKTVMVSAPRIRPIDHALLEVNVSGVWTDITGPTKNININRNDSDVGTMSAEILDATLDPTVAATIRPGRRVRVSAKNGDTWSPQFTGTIDNVDVAYEPLANEGKKVNVRISASDNVSYLANQAEPRGVGTINELRWIVTGVPFNINGAATPLGSGTVVSMNDSASLWDNVLITRDSNLGYAWVGKDNTLNVFDHTAIDTTTKAVFGPNVYSNLDVDFTLDQIINSVIVNWMRYNIGTETSASIAYPAVQDAASIAEWGVRQATFTVQGATEVEANIVALANDVLARNATAEVRPRTAAVTIRDTDDLVFIREVDLNSYVDVVYTDGVTTKEMRVTGINQTITADKWTVDFEFSLPNGVTAPSVAPSTSTSIIPPGSITEVELDPDIVDDILSASQLAQQALDDAAASFDYAETKNKVYYQTTVPSGGVYLTGDTWFDTDDGNKVYVYNGTAFVLARDTGIAAATTAASNAASAASAAQSTANTGVTNAATAQTAANNAATAASTAQTAANNAATLAGTKGKTYIQSTAPAADANSLWIDTTGGSNLAKRWDGSAWVAVQDAAIQAAATAAANAQTAANNAQTAANNAATAAGTAQTTANGKNTVTYSTALPGTNANKAGDIWFVRDGAGTITAQYEGMGGTTWTSRTLNSSVIANLDAGKITAGSTFTSSLNVKSTFTLGDASVNGIIESFNYAGSTTGVQISKNGLIAKGGSLTGALVQTDAAASRGVKLISDGMTVHNNSGGLAMSFTASTGALVINGPITSGGSITGASITASSTGVIQTEGTANRGIKMNSAGFTAYNSGGSPTVTIDAASGAVNILGNLTSGSIITGADLRGSTFTTRLDGAATGERVVIRNDGSGGIVEFFTGMSGEVLPGAIDPILDGSAPALRLQSGTSGSLPYQSLINLAGGSNTKGGSITMRGAGVYVYSDIISLEANTQVTQTLYTNTIRPYTGAVISLGDTTTAVTVPGMIKTGLQSINVAAINTQYTANVSFATAFPASAAIPTIMLTLRGINNASAQIRVSTSNVTRSGFTITITRSAGTGSTDVDWLAVGV